MSYLLSNGLLRGISLARYPTPFASAVSCRRHKSACSRLEVDENSSRTVAYRQIISHPTDNPTVVYVPGLHSYSHMRGMMAQCLLTYCDINKINCIAYDHECMGESSGNVNDLLFKHWVQDVLTVIDKLTEGPIVLVSLSMGGWLSLVAARERAHRIHGLVMYAPALNYVFPYYMRHREMLPEEVRKRLDAGDIHVNEHSYGDALLKKDFAEDSRKYEFDLGVKTIRLDCPVRILHGVRDQEVKATRSMELLHAIETPDVDLIYRKGAGHQAEDPPDIEMILNTMDRLIKDYPVRTTS